VGEESEESDIHVRCFENVLGLFVCLVGGGDVENRDRMEREDVGCIGKYGNRGEEERRIFLGSMKQA